MTNLKHFFIHFQTARTTDHRRRRAMGGEPRLYAEERYDVRKVNAVMLREMGMAKRDEG